MTHRNATTLGWLAILLISVIACIATVRLSRECDHRGGVLVRNAWNWPACITRGSEP